MSKTTRVRLKPTSGGGRQGAGSRQRPLGIKVAGLGTDVLVRTHPAARRLTLRVSQVKREVVLTMPANVSLSEASRFVSQHRDWVRQRLDALPETVLIDDGVVILYRGERHRIEFLGPTRHARPAWVEGTRAAQQALRLLQEGKAESRRASVRLPDRLLPRLCVSGHHEFAPRRLRDWLVQRAGEELDARVAHHAGKLGLRPRRITVRDQVSRWGSCSSTRVLSFSWRLILAPPVVLDYVAAHEVAHLKEMNHGPRFWALLKRTMPEMDEARRWLKRHGAELHRYSLAD